MRSVLATIIAIASVFMLARSARAQGMPIDSLNPRFAAVFPQSALNSLHEILSDGYDDERVWGLAIGDFSNDSLADLAISLYNIKDPKHEVTVHLLLFDGKTFTDILQKKYTYYETPIEVGLTIDGSVLSILQKFDDLHWRQEGFSYESGDLVTVDEMETEREDIPLLSGKGKAMAHYLYKNYETLRTRESFYATKDNTTMLGSEFFTFPAYNRLRFVYPGYGRDMTDTTERFVTKGASFRHDWKDCSIKRGLAAYDDDYIYISLSVNDDQVWGGNEDPEKNDRVTLWFDAFNGDSRYFTKEKKGSIPQFRTQTDSTIYNITFSLPALLAQTPKISVSSVAALSNEQREAIGNIRASITRDTADGVVSGYTLKARIPFAYFGMEANPIGAYETRSAEAHFDDERREKQSADEALFSNEAFPVIGFTAVVTDVDNPNHSDEITQQATSKFDPNDPSTFGEIVMIPTGVFYGNVRPSYTKKLTDELIKAGY